VKAPAASSPVELVSRISAATLGTAAVSLLASICLARFLPLEAEARFAVGFTLAIPIWLASMCLGFLARTGGRAWLWCLVLALLLGMLAFGIDPT
jgi:hypothetical protein